MPLERNKEGTAFAIDRVPCCKMLYILDGFKATVGPHFARTGAPHWRCMRAPNYTSLRVLFHCVHLTMP